MIGAWYGSLTFSLFSVITAFHLSMLLSTYDTRKHGIMLLIDSIKRGDEKEIYGSSLFILQIPNMLLSYSIISYIVGLCLMIVQPLWRSLREDNIGVSRQKGVVVVTLQTDENFTGCYRLPDLFEPCRWHSLCSVHIYIPDVSSSSSAKGQKLCLTFRTRRTFGIELCTFM